jgi:predicted nucleic acid-binding Zn ribbon protein
MSELKLMMRCRLCQKITDPSKWTVAPGTEEDGICPFCGGINRAAEGRISVMTDIACEASSVMLSGKECSCCGKEVPEARLNVGKDTCSEPCSMPDVYNTFAKGTLRRCNVCNADIPHSRIENGESTCSDECSVQRYEDTIHDFAISQED